MSEIIIKGQKTPTRCEICHKADVFVPHLNSCFRCHDMEMDSIDEQDRASQNYYQEQYHQHRHQQYAQASQYKVVTSPNKRTRTYPSKTPLQKVVTNLKLTKMGELPNLPSTNANANQAFPSISSMSSMVSKASYNNTYRPQQIYISYPKQRGIFFQIGMFVGVIMAVMFLFSLFLTK